MIEDIMTHERALQALEDMEESQFQEFFKSLPYRVQLSCHSGLVNWRKVLPDWYIQKINKLDSSLKK